MDPQACTVESNQAGERYTVVLAALRSLLFAYTAQPFSMKSMNGLRSEAVALAETFSRTEATIIRHRIRNTAQNAQRSALSDLDRSEAVTPPDDTSEAFLKQSEDFLLAAIKTQLARDIETVVRRYREFGLETQIKAFSRPFPNLEIERVQFLYRDRAGRLIPSERFVRLAWRHSLVVLGAEFYLLCATHAGAKTCVVTHADPQHRFQGVQIQIAASHQGEPFTDLRDRIFHPMTDAVLKASF